ncbi:MAG: endonuclease domain-containing protein [Bacteroidia bacterium]|nr:endonuclease domain-containing protein [Bacteroidia bacterium]
MSGNTIIPYNPKLKKLARELRNNSTLAEVILWQNIKGRSYGHEFHRQVPIDEFIVDFYCHELKLAIEIDGNTHDYNFDNDEIRQSKLESYKIALLRFNDNDVKRNITDVLRSIEFKITEIENREIEEKHPPAPFKGGIKNQSPFK